LFGKTILNRVGGRVHLVENGGQICKDKWEKRLLTDKGTHRNYTGNRRIKLWVRKKRKYIKDLARAKKEKAGEKKVTISGDQI